jgi:hypothetical protein
MIRLKALKEKHEWDWVWKRAHPPKSDASQGIVAYDDKTGKISGIVVMDTWTRSGCHVHFAIDNPMCIRAGLFREVSRHVHGVGERKYMFGFIPASNKKSLNLTKKIGFTEVGSIPDGHSEGVDFIILRMSREENRWLPKELLQEAA